MQHNNIDGYRRVLENYNFAVSVAIEMRCVITFYLLLQRISTYCLYVAIKHPKFTGRVCDVCSSRKNYDNRDYNCYRRYEMRCRLKALSIVVIPHGCAGYVDYLVTAFPMLHCVPRLNTYTTADLDSSRESWSNGHV